MGTKFRHENLKERDSFEDINLHKMHLSKAEYMVANCFHLDEERNQIRDIVSTVINRRVK
jgi:hypothetical protein